MQPFQTHIPFVLRRQLALQNSVEDFALRAREDQRMAGGGDDGRGCHGRDKTEDGCIELCGADSLLSQLSVIFSVLFEIKGKGAHRGGDSDSHCEWSGVGM
jgi:hypothetical protein